MALTKKDFLNVSLLHLEAIESILNFFKCSKCKIIAESPQQCQKCYEIVCHDCNQFCNNPDCQNARLTELNSRDLNIIRYLAYYVDKSDHIFKQKENEIEPQDEIDELAFITTRITPKLELLNKAVEFHNKDITMIHQQKKEQERFQVTRGFMDQPEQLIEELQEKPFNKEENSYKTTTMWKCPQCSKVNQLEKKCLCGKRLEEFEDIESILVQAVAENLLKDDKGLKFSKNGAKPFQQSMSQISQSKSNKIQHQGQEVRQVKRQLQNQWEDEEEKAPQFQQRNIHPSWEEIEGKCQFSRPPQWQKQGDDHTEEFKSNISSQRSIGGRYCIQCDERLTPLEGEVCINCGIKSSKKQQSHDPWAQSEIECQKCFTFQQANNLSCINCKNFLPRNEYNN